MDVSHHGHDRLSPASHSVGTALMKLTPGPWRWGYWMHRPDLAIAAPNPQAGKHWPMYEFRESGDVLEGLVLSACDYGTLMKLEDVRNILDSHSAGYGGETDIDVSEKDKLLIAAAPKLLAAVKELVRQCSNCANASKCVKHEEARAAISKAEGDA